MTAEALEKRKPVWLALSEFYLDTELTDQDLIRINRIFENSGYSLRELQAINAGEVGLVLRVNLWSVAGVWNGFDPAWLCEEIARQIAGRKRRNPVFRWIHRMIIHRATRSYWQRIEGLRKRRS